MRRQRLTERRLRFIVQRAGGQPRLDRAADILPVFTVVVAQERLNCLPVTSAGPDLIKRSGTVKEPPRLVQGLLQTQLAYQGFQNVWESRKLKFGKGTSKLMVKADSPDNA